MQRALWLCLAFALTCTLVGCGGGGGGSDDPDGFQRESGSLGGSDNTLTSGEFADDYNFSADVGQLIEVTMTSTEIDPYLIVKPPSCGPSGTCEAQYDNDDLQSGDTRAFAWLSANESGSWQILATSSVPGEEGSYELAYRVVDAGSEPATPGVTSFTEGASRQGRLQAGDKTLTSGEFVDNYTFTGRAGDRVQVDMRSDELDPYLILWMPDKTQQDNDDWEGDTAHSRIEWTLPEDGMYRVSATTYTPGEEGSYSLDVGLMSGGGGDTGSDEAPFEKD